ncbi:MAG: iron ABC transporter permease [Roseiflexaceae bacterium]|nr:iron ABC transporter permease [Roseiflexaceae bacterium]
MALSSGQDAILTMPRPPGMRRLFVLCSILIALLCGLALVALARGVPNLSLVELWFVLSGRNENALLNAVVLGVRLPRLILSILAGAALGVTGVLLQDTLRNGLAGPELLGVSAGAAAAIATMVVFQLPISFAFHPWFALLGASLGGGIVLLAQRRSRDPLRLLLIGAAVTALLNAYVITVISLGRRGDFSLILLFLRGTVAGRGWDYVELFLPWALIGIPLALLCARPLNLLGLGDELSEGLGLPVFWARLGMLTLAAAMVAAVVAVCGPISFISLLTPHLTRRVLATYDARRVLPGSALMGATLLVSADQAGRLFFEPVELPAGLWTTLLATPLLLALLRRERSRTAVAMFGEVGLRLSFVPLLLLSLASVGALVVLHIAIGRVALSPGQVVAALLQTPLEPFHRQIVWDVRLPRALIAPIAGAMLGLSGALLQALTRNPLAEPGLMGVTAGAVLTVVLTLTATFIWSLPQPAGELPLVGLAGGLAAGALVYVLSWQGRTDPTRLALTGLLVLGALESLTSIVLHFYGSQISGTALLWIVGSLNGRGWAQWAILWPWALVAVPSGLLCAAMANVLQLGEEPACGLGLPLERTRVLLLAVAALLTATAVAVVGAIGFIGLIGPHLARQLVGSDTRRILPLSALLSAAILQAADIATQSALFSPLIGPKSILPVGAVTALLGAPFLLWLVWKGQRR